MELIHACLIFGVLISLTGCRNSKQQSKGLLAEKPSTQAGSSKDEISRIDNFVHTVNDHKSLFIIKKTILGTDDGGQLIGYYDRQVLTKIDVWLGMSNNALSQQFYFKNGHLIFAKETRKYYSWDQNKGEINRDKLSKTETEKFYYQNGILIQRIPKETKNPKRSDLLSQARTYIKFLSMKEKTVFVNQ
jgi:hypothetical protein